MKLFGNHNKDYAQSCHSFYESISCTAQARPLAGSRYDARPSSCRSSLLGLGFLSAEVAYSKTQGGFMPLGKDAVKFSVYSVLL